MMLRVECSEFGMNRWVPALQITGIGFYIALCIVGGALAGWYLSGKNPLFLIIGLLLGLVVAFYGAYRMIRPLVKNNNDKENG